MDIWNHPQVQQYKSNLNFGLMYEKAKHCWALSTNILFLFSWYFFLIKFCFLMNWHKYSNYFKIDYFKIAVWQSDSMKRNFGGFKVKMLWEGHKIWKNLPPVLTKQLFLLSSVKTSGRFFQIFLAFSEKQNFTSRHANLKWP